jgi:hypothetical protein
MSERYHKLPSNMPAASAIATRKHTSCGSMRARLLGFENRVRNCTVAALARPRRLDGRRLSADVRLARRGGNGRWEQLTVLMILDNLDDEQVLDQPLRTGGDAPDRYLSTHLTLRDCLTRRMTPEGASFVTLGNEDMARDVTEGLSARRSGH